MLQNYCMSFFTLWDLVIVNLFKTQSLLRRFFSWLDSLLSWLIRNFITTENQRQAMQQWLRQQQYLRISQMQNRVFDRDLLAFFYHYNIWQVPALEKKNKKNVFLYLQLFASGLLLRENISSKKFLTVFLVSQLPSPALPMCICERWSL